MPADRIRTTISVDPAVLAVFQRMADASGKSVSRCMGDWLADTAEGATYVAQKMIQYRAAPRAALQDIRGLVDSAAVEADALLAGLSGAGTPRRGRSAQPGRARAEGAPPSSLTGVKSPSKPARKGGKS